MKNSVFSTLQKVGQALMIPVSVLPAAGLLVALGRLLQDVNQPAIQVLGKVFFSGGLAIFEQLSVVFAVGVAIGFTGGAGVAGLAAVVGYFTMTNVIKVVGDARHLELAINTGVFGGILIGLMTASLYKGYSQTKLPAIFGFFSGKRLVPIVTAASAILVGLVLSYVWPPIQVGINHFGASIMDSTLGPAFYAAGKRLLIPVGLHHVYYPPFLYQFGEFVTQAGQVLHGESPRYFGGDPTAGRFMASEFPLMLFGLPAAAFAMYLRAEPSRRKAVGGVMLTAALTSIITGITEPIEFAFIFVAPILFVFHVLAAFISGLLTNAFDIHLGYTFSASLIDFVLGFFNQKNSLMLFAVVGPLVAGVYFGVFYFTIGALNLKTPGRDTETESEVQTATGSNRAREILAALGGNTNIVTLDACITRLRLSVKDAQKVNKNRLKELGAAGTLDAGGGNFQVIFGVESDQLKEEIKSVMAQPTLSAQAVRTLRAPMRGRMVELKDVPDATFADKILGDGFAIEPKDSIVYSPVDAKVVNVFHTRHALGLATPDGLEILIHVGVDTVKMAGKGFKTFVSEGDTVKAGDKLLEFDLNLVKQEAKSTITPVIVTNMDKVSKLTVIKTGDVQVGDRLVDIR